MRAVHALEYRLASLVHWAPREKAVMHALDRLRSEVGRRIGRVIDMGCGPGLLASPVTALGLAYVGIDPEAAFIDRCRARGHHRAASFHVGSVTHMPIEISTSDAFVLNGVAHHLDENQIRLALAHAQKAGGLIVCDHWRADQRSALARWLQAADRGKFIRPIEVFEQLPGFVCRDRQFFNIGLGPLHLWPYFCLAYTPE